MRIVKLAQGSPEWHEHREKHRNASETPAVLGVSPWVTPYQLWLQRTGRAEAQVNPAMLRGTQLEPAAREAYEQLTGLIMEPLVLVDGDYSASLDGITLDGELILEVKCPMSKDSQLLADAKAGRVSVQVYWQIQAQFLVSGAHLGHLYVFDGKSGILLEQKPEPQCWDRIRQEWDRFMELIRRDQPPGLTERDTVTRQDPEWQTSAEAYIALKRSADKAAEQLDAAKQRLMSLATHARVEGAGVSVTRFWKAGNVEYKRVPQLEGVDLESYRGQGREEVRITILK